MALKFTSLADDYSRYLQSFEAYLECSSEHHSFRNFICETLSDMLSSIGEGKSTLNVMGVGSGSGEMDLEILAELHAKHPEAQLEYEVVEPSSNMLQKYKGLVSKTPGLDHITFRWYNMSASEFMSDWRKRNPEKKMDFIHMIQMLYYEKDLESTISFYRSLLNKNGKLLINLDSGTSGLNRLWKTFQTYLCKNELNQAITAEEITNILDTKGIPYQMYKVMSEVDIIECFTAGNERGELLLDFLTEVMDFRKNAPPELLENVLELLKHPECSRKVNGRIMFDCTSQSLVLDP